MSVVVLLVECQSYVQVDLWKRKAEILEMVVVVEFENLEMCLEKWAFARFHPPDHWSRKQSWREEWYVLANAEVCKLADSDLDMLVIAPHVVVCVIVFGHPDLAVDVVFQLQRDFSGVLFAEVACSL